MMAERPFSRPAAWPRKRLYAVYQSGFFFFVTAILCIIMAKPLINKDFACPKNCSKKVKKMLTSPYCFETLSVHTVTTEQKNRKKYEN